MTNVSLCIVTWNPPDLFFENLEGICSRVKADELEVIVVDNGSTEDISGRLRQKCPACAVIRNNVNKGVAAGRNQCLRRARGRVLLFLDDDVDARNFLWDQTLDIMTRDADIALLGPRLVYPDGTLQNSCRRFPTPWGVVWRWLGMEKFKMFQACRFVKDYLMRDDDHAQMRNVDWVMGACQLVKREALEEVGGFDEKYFFGYEDVDLCRRLKEQGYKILYAPQVEAVHHYQRRSARGINRFTLFHAKSICHYFWKHHFQKMPTAAAKRVFDIILSLTGLFFLWPLFLIFAFLIKRDSKGPFLFAHKRVGRHGALFSMVKFRTMRDGYEKYGKKPAKDSGQITSFGRFLRESGLDELPQLWNVLTGQMSLVGPRPEMPFIVRQYSRTERKRLAVRPGITGLWQISGKTDDPIHENINFDLDYIKRQSLGLDVKILIKTFFNTIDRISRMR